MSKKNRGFFITFEGIEGSGKSTQIDLLARHLREKGHDVVVTRDPGGTELGDNIRDILLDPEFSSMDSYTELFLYAASRAQLVIEVIEPALKAGKIVLCDRFTDSTIAYQGFGRGLSFDRIETLNRWAAKEILPQLTIILTIPAQDGLDRATRDSIDRIEEESIDFHQRVENGYNKLAQEHPGRICVIDASGSRDEIQRHIVRIVEEFLEKGR